MTLYHGSEFVVEKPQLTLGKEHNDYGRGFYCTEDKALACEWACKENNDGFANEYSLNPRGLRILNLLDPHYSILNWIALLLKNRTFSIQEEIAVDARDYVLENFLIDTSDYDVVVGYRADDSYFSYAQSFINNAMPIRSLDKALRLGKLGVQVALVGERAFTQLKFVSMEFADREIHYPRFFSRDTQARTIYRDEIKRSRSYRDDIFVMDILREEIKNDDARIQRIVSE